MTGFVLGQFLAGACIGGLVPLFIFFMKNRYVVGILCPFICGLVGLWNSWASIICGVALVVTGLMLPKKVKEGSEEQEEESEDDEDDDDDDDYDEE